MNYEDTRPVVFLSVFKGGTHLVRWILEALTGQRCFEPPITRGRVDYHDPAQLMYRSGHFYSWHLVPEPEIADRLRRDDARTVFLLRNVCDLAVSMYHHFADNIDADAGRGRNVDHYFRDLTFEEGLTAIIEGMQRPDFHWRGLGPHLRHMELMLSFAQTHPTFVTTYSRIGGSRKRLELRRLSNYLDLDPCDAELEVIATQSDFNRMKARAVERGQGSHYRRGLVGGDRDRLESEHLGLIRDTMQHWAPDLPYLVERHGLPEVLEGSRETA